MRGCFSPDIIASMAGGMRGSPKLCRKYFVVSGIRKINHLHIIRKINHLHTPSQGYIEALSTGEPRFNIEGQYFTMLRSFFIFLPNSSESFVEVTSEDIHHVDFNFLVFKFSPK